MVRRTPKFEYVNDYKIVEIDGPTFQFTKEPTRLVMISPTQVRPPLLQTRFRSQTIPAR